MIIWKGWGILVVVISALSAIVFGVLGSLITGNGTEISTWGAGVGLIVGAALSYFAGTWFNVTRPARQTQEWAQERGKALAEAIDTGRFQAIPGIAPSSRQEAEQQAAAMLETDMARANKALRNQHSLFWIPMQWAAVLPLMMGVSILFAGLSSN